MELIADHIGHRFGALEVLDRVSFTGRSGEYVPIAETIRGFKEIIEGRHDDVPERVFFMKGSIDQVVEEAKQG